MKTNRLWIAMALISFLITVSLATMVFAQGPTDSQPDGPGAAPPRVAPDISDDSRPNGTPEVQIPDQYRADQMAADDGVPVATVYFTPQDENTSTTVIFLYNTSTVTATVGINTYTLSGSQFISTTVAVPAGNLVRICADSVSTVSSSWQDVVLINFTTSSAYGKMTLPEGVKAEGYVVWNDASAYDPLQVAPTLPLRFSVDPPTVFLPTIQKE